MMPACDAQFCTPGIHCDLLSKPTTTTTIAPTSHAHLVESFDELIAIPKQWRLQTDLVCTNLADLVEELRLFIDRHGGNTEETSSKHLELPAL